MALTLYDVERMQEVLKEEILEEVRSMIAKETEYVEKLIPEEPWAINEWEKPEKTGLKFITEPKPKPKEASKDEPWNNPKLQFVNNKWVEKPEGKSYCYLTKEWLPPEQVKANIKLELTEKD